MRLLTLNVNGFRSAVKHGLWDLISDQCIDVACFQEIKGLLETPNHTEYTLPEFVGAISPVPNHYGVATMAKQSLQLLSTNVEEPHPFRGVSSVLSWTMVFKSGMSMHQPSCPMKLRTLYTILEWSA